MPRSILNTIGTIKKLGHPFSVMSIRAKFLLTILCITICLIAIFYTVISRIVHDNFDQLEKKMVIESLKRVQVTLSSQAQALSALAQYWASNDATSAFVNNHDKKYIARNIIQDPLNNRANIDLLLILNTEESLLLGVVFDKRNHKAKDIDPQFLHSIINHDNFLKYMHDNTGKSGIIQFGDRYLNITISPILDSKGKGPVHGTLVMGRILDTEGIAQLQKLTLTSVNLYPVNDISSEAVAPLSALLSSESPYHITAYSDKIVKGYTFLDDLSGNAVLLLGIAIERGGHQQGDKTIFFLLYAIIFISLVFGLVFFFFIDIIISRRLSAMITAINTIEKSSDHGLRIEQPLLEDDLGKLTISINHMLDANEALEEYKLKNEKLEALATFAAGATHELATPLATIAIASSEILHDIEENAIIEEDLHDDMLLIRNQVNKCKDLLYQLAAGAGEHMGEELVSFSIQDLIDESLTIFTLSTIQQIKVSIQIADHILTMPFLSLRRVLRGILKNSLDASKPGKPIFLSCKENHTHLIFEVMDQGEGMDEHTLRHAVDPFFTTKPPGKGTGLGLYLAQSLTGRFNGKLQITSSPSTGTTVTLSFAKENIYVGLR